MKNRKTLKNTVQAPLGYPSTDATKTHIIIAFVRVIPVAVRAPGVIAYSDENAM